MGGASFGRMGLIAAMAAGVSLGEGGIVASSTPPSPDRRPSRRTTPAGRGSIATGNRHTGEPHEHKREIARRQRQAARGTATITVRLGRNPDPYAEIPV